MKCNALIAAVVVAAGGLLTGCEALTAEMAIDHYVVGKLAMERQDYKVALAELARAIECDGDLSLAHTAIGDIHRKQGSYGLAASAYERACDVNPYAFRPHYNLGVTYQFLAEAAEAAEAVARYIRKAVRVYLRAVTIKPEDFDANLNLSACYFQQGKYELAEQYCKAAVKLAPEKPFAYSNLGIIYDAQNRPYDAIRAYKDSLERDVHQPNVLMNLGSTYMRLGRLTEALRAFELASREAPQSPAPWVQSGACRYRRKEMDLAVSAYNKAISLNSRSAEAYRGLGVVYMSQFVVQRDNADLRDKALDAWNRSLEFNSNQPDLLRLVRKYAPVTASPEL